MHILYGVYIKRRKGDIVDIEKVQKRATKLISLKTLPYKERLRKLKLPILKYRSLRGDMMIEVYKIINNM